MIEVRLSFDLVRNVVERRDVLDQERLPGELLFRRS